MSQKQAIEFMLDVISALEKKGRSGNYISSIVISLKSWLAWNDRRSSTRPSSIASWA